MSAPLKLVATPEDYFRELVTEAIKNNKVKLKPEAEFYLVNLMSQFISVNQLYSCDQDGNLKSEPLALMIKEALETEQERARQAMLRRVGDVSLYTAGFFQDSFTRKMVDVDYYIEMGESAYQGVAEQSQEEVMKQLYGELAQKFAQCVELLAEISAKTTQKTEADLLRLYELWMRTGSDRAEKALKEAGIVPNKSIKKSMQ